jgi:hypothetical protein
MRPEVPRVQAEQRALKTAEAFEPVDQAWVPFTVHGAAGGRRMKVKVAPDDRYACVDDVADGAVVFVVSDWPCLDREGRLYWETDPVEVVGADGEVQAIVDAARADAGITAPDRPIRVGDAFLVRGLPDKRSALDQASLVLDVSAAARDAAKAALYGAVASTLGREDAERMAVTQRYQDAEPSTGYFDVRQVGVAGPDGAETTS